MIYQNVMLHNIAEIAPDPLPGGPLLRRLPDSVRLQLNTGSQRQYMVTVNSEIRFVMNGDTAYVTLACSGALRTVTVFAGDFFLQRVDMPECEPVRIDISLPEQIRDCLPRLGGAFSPNVIRIVPHRSRTALLDIEGDVRPPRPDELPSKTLLAYGTSITQGLSSSMPHYSYAALTARRLGCDLVNLGTSGSAYCEKEIADYMAGLKNWDAAILGISVNMLSAFSAEEFAARAEYMARTLALSAPDKPVFCIGILPFFEDLGYSKNKKESRATAEDYRRALSDIVHSGPANLHYIDGACLLSVTGLSADLLHPSDHGMLEISERLAPLISSKL